MSGTTISTVISDRHREVAVLLGGIGCAFALVSLATWSPGDPTPLNPGTGRVENLCGPLGALLADALLAVLGHGAWIVGLPLVLGVLHLAGRKLWGPWRWLAAAGLYITSLAVVQLALRPGGAFAPGGAVGGGIVAGLEAIAGGVGAAMLLAGSFLVFVTWVARIDWSRLARALVDRVEAGVPVLVDRVRAVVVWIFGIGRRGVGASFAAAWAAMRAAVAMVVGSVSRMFASLRRGAAGDEFSEGAGLLSFDADGVDIPPSDVDGMADDDHTQVAAGGVDLAEVEWDPTTIGPASQGSDVLEMFPDFAQRESTRTDEVPRSSATGFERPPAPAPWEESKPSVVPAAADARSADDDRQYGHDEDDSSLDDSGYDDSSYDDDSLVDTPPSVNVAPPAVPAGTKTVKPKTVKAKKKAGDNVQVHEAEFLKDRVKDDGGALSRNKAFELPRLSLLDLVPEQDASFDQDELRELAVTVEDTLKSFNIGGQVTAVKPGPVITVFEFLPDAGIRVSRIAALSDDLAMAMHATRVRIVAPIPGRGVVGIEIPSKTRLTIFLREVLAHDAFRKSKAALPCVLGKDVTGKPVVGDLARMPHLLVGGTTGSGKSVGVNGMLLSMLFTRPPEELRMLLIDPKMLEFEMYEGIPHLLHPVITEPNKASSALAWACREMDDRYRMLARWGTRNIVNYNKKVTEELADWTLEKQRQYAPKNWDGELPLEKPAKLPYIVIVIDELADLMMCAGKEVEESVVRIAQKARACGIHLIVATQRPSADVVTGLIKANLPTRVSYQLRTKLDSRVILDQNGAESLLGMGDLLYLPPGVGDLNRCHGAFVSDAECLRVTNFLREQREPEYLDDLGGDEDGGPGDMGSERDDLYEDAVEIVVSAGKASTSMVQRHLKIGYNRAARIIDCMEADGIIGPADGARPREVLVNQAS